VLKYLQKHFKPATASVVVDNTAQAEHNEEVVTMVDGTETLDAANASANVDVAALQSAVASLTEQLTAKDTLIASLTAQVDAAHEFKAAAEKAAAEARVAARTSKLTALVGNVQAASLQAATASMDEASFEAVVSALSLKTTVEANSAEFSEVGVDGNADAAKLVAEANGSRVMDYLKTISHENQAQ